MNVQELLKTRKAEILDEIATLKSEITDIDIALVHLTADNPETQDTDDISRFEAIREAIKNGNRKPAAIHKYMTQTLGVRMPIGSLRSTLSRLKSDGKIHRNESGWRI